MDAISKTRIQLLHPKLRAEAELILSEIEKALTGKAMCRFTHTLRTWEEQDNLYQQGRTTPGQIVTNAKAGSSYHNYGLAIDIALVLDKDGNGSYETASWDTKGDYDADKISDWMEVVSIFKKHGWEAGIEWKNFPDAPHFQKTFGYSIAQLKTKYQKKDFIAGSIYVQV
jgi:D-alanyl-D-alanine carboxypeptidase.